MCIVYLYINRKYMCAYFVFCDQAALLQQAFKMSQKGLEFSAIAIWAMGLPFNMYCNAMYLQFLAPPSGALTSPPTHVSNCHSAKCLYIRLDTGDQDTGNHSPPATGQCPNIQPDTGDQNSGTHSPTVNVPNVQISGQIKGTRI